MSGCCEQSGGVTGSAGAPGPTSPDLIFANIAAMAAFLATTTVSGTSAKVLTLEAEWTLLHSDTQTPDTSPAAPLGATVVAANGGGGNWVREPWPSEVWQAQTVWHLNDPSAAASNVENDGLTAPTAIPPDEYLRRTAGASGRIPIFDNGITVVVFIDGTLFTPLLLPFSTKGPGAFANVAGTTNTVLRTGTFTAGTVALVKSPYTPWQIADSALTVGWTNANGAGLDLTGNLIFDTTVGSWAWILQAKGGSPKTAYPTQWCTGLRTTNDAAASGNAYSVQSLINAHAIHVSDDGVGVVEVQDLDCSLVGAASTAVQTGLGTIQFFRCKFTTLETTGAIQFLSCLSGAHNIQGLSVSAGFFAFAGGATSISAEIGGVGSMIGSTQAVELDGRFFCGESGVTVQSGAALVLTSAQAADIGGAFGVIAAALTIEPGAIVRNAEFFGSSPVRFVVVRSVGAGVYTALPTGTGTTGAIAIGGTNFLTWAALPAGGYVESNQAAFVAYA